MEWDEKFDEDKTIENNTPKSKINRIRKRNVVNEDTNINKKRENNNYLEKSKINFAKCVLSVVWLIINIVALLFFATYSNSAIDLFITLSLPLNMVMIVLSFSKSESDSYDEFIK